MTLLSRLPIVAGLALAGAGCSTPTPVVNSSGALKAFEPISASPADTCPTQKAIARHNSAYDSLRKGKPVSYKAACEAVKQLAAEPKTS
jgi:hypothetical protein